MVVQARVHRFAMHWHRMTQRTRLRKENSTKEGDIPSPIISATCKLDRPFTSQLTGSPSAKNVLVSERMTSEGLSYYSLCFNF